MLKQQQKQQQTSKQEKVYSFRMRLSSKIPCQKFLILTSIQKGGFKTNSIFSI